MKTNLKKQTGDIVKTFALTGAVLCAAVIVVYGLSRGDWIKGVLADLCHLSSEKTASIRRDIDALAGKGRRVIGVAVASFEKSSLPEAQHDFEFAFLGLLGLHDPVRENVPVAIDLCRRAGIRVIMITGDHPITAKNIAGKIGLDD